MKYAAAAALIGFIAIAVFGFAGFGVNADSAFMDCLHSLFGAQEDCHALGIAHARIYQSFSTALLVAFALFLGLAAMAIFNAACRFAPIAKVHHMAAAPELSKGNWQLLHIAQNPLL